MAKVWKAGDHIPIAHVNELEEIAVQYEKLIKDLDVKKPSKSSQQEAGAFSPTNAEGSGAEGIDAKKA
jgi:predicted negative regulator of RcsB-dependent stress response